MKRLVRPVLIVGWALVALSLPSLVGSDTTLTAAVAAQYGSRTESVALHDIAHGRAVEIAADFSHDGRREGTSEVLAWNQNTDDPISGAVQQWVGSAVHDAILADPSLTRIGCAEHVAADTHWFACVLAPGITPAPAPAATPAPILAPAEPVVTPTSALVPDTAARPFCERKREHWKCAAPTAAPTPSATASPSPVPTANPTPTPTPTAAPSATPPPTPSFSPSSRWQQVFHDDFDWAAAEGEFPAITNGRWSAYPHGWPDTSGNGTYDPGIVSVHDGVLDKYLRFEDGEFKVAAITPKWNGSAYQLYGRYEVRFRADPVDGYKTAWLLWPQSEVWPRDGEIDFPEGSLDGTICAFMHRQGATSGSDQDAFCTDTTYTDWHTAVIEWEPDRIGFYLDGNLIGESTSRIPNTPMRWVIQTETEIRSEAPPTSAAGHVYIDHVTVWEYAP